MEVLCKVYDLPPDDPKIRKEENEVLETLKIEREHGEYRWSQLLKRDEVQTGRRVLLAYGMQFMNQMGGINLVVGTFPKLSSYIVDYISTLLLCALTDTSVLGLLHHISVGTERWS